MTQRQIDTIIQLANEPGAYAKWSAFARAEGITRHAIRYWRLKLSLPVRPYKARPAAERRRARVQAAVR